MASVPVIELGFRVQYPPQFPGGKGLQTSPAIRFQDIESQVSRYYRQLSAARREEASAQDNRFATKGFKRWVWARLEEFFERRSEHLIEKIRAYMLDLLQRDYQIIDLQLAWPSASSPFEPLTAPARVGEIAYGLMKANDIWLREVDPVAI